MTPFSYCSGQYEILGTTRDDAIGECYDKVGHLLGIETKPKECMGAALERVAKRYVISLSPHS
jgi:tRNA A37 threonylcarbamoyltransferase TsaD